MRAKIPQVCRLKVVADAHVEHLFSPTLLKIFTFAKLFLHTMLCPNICSDSSNVVEDLANLKDDAFGIHPKIAAGGKKSFAGPD